MVFQKLPSIYEKSEGRKYRDAISNAFLEYFYKKGFQKESPVQITSGIDSSVHFVGAAISTLKPYIREGSIPNSGLMVAQPCLRARNVNKLLQDDFNFEWGACFGNVGLITPYNNFENICKQTFSFLYDELGFSKDELVVRVSSKDVGFVDLCDKFCLGDMIEKDTFPDKYYTHTIGMSDFIGRNFNFSLKHPAHNEFKDVGNFIVFSNVGDNKPAFIEVGFGDTTILKEMYALDHILDAFPVPEIICDKKNEQRIIEDCIIASMTLSKEGLAPSSKNSQAKILSKYVRALHYYTSKNNITTEELLDVMSKYEENEYCQVDGSAKKIVDFIETKKEHIEHLNVETFNRVNLALKHNELKKQLRQ